MNRLSVELPSFFKSKCCGQFVALNTGFAALEWRGVRVDEIRLNEIDWDILRSDHDFAENHQKTDDGILVWAARIVVDDSVDSVRLSGERDEKLDETIGN